MRAGTLYGALARMGRRGWIEEIQTDDYRALPCSTIPTASNSILPNAARGNSAGVFAAQDVFSRSLLISAAFRGAFPSEWLLKMTYTSFVPAVASISCIRWTHGISSLTE
jgi:hypothetical protein